MKTQSTIKPQNYKIEDRENGKVAVYFFTNIQAIEKKEQEQETTEQEEQKMYSYDMYVIELQKQNNLEERIKNNYDMWLDFVKQKEYDKLAEEIRTKRNKLLEDTDKEMCLDRLNLNLPTELSATTLLAGVKQFFDAFSDIFNGKMAKYRQELRDITKQKDFPYSVIWPTKDEEE